ncbi:MAG: mannose-1-phosphate guanylyltransferase, partial [Burkholderiales bacterium]
INLAHLGTRIEAALGDGARWGARIRYSREPEALETAGGIALALPLLGDDPFLVVNGDIWTDFDFGRFRTAALQMTHQRLLAWCVLVENPVHHRRGDFGLRAGMLTNDDPARLTFSGIALYRRELFASVVPGTRTALAPLLRAACAGGRVGGELHAGRWVDVGTPQRLAELDGMIGAGAANARR